MESTAIKNHWTKWAKEFKTDLRATTKAQTIKHLEVNAIYRAIKRTGLLEKKEIEVMEAGCGNGYNCFALSNLIKGYNFTGIDYIPDMIKNAKIIQNQDARKYKNIMFEVGDVLSLEKNKILKEKYDIVFTDRCLINLNKEELQIKAINQLIKKVKKNGYLIILENFLQNYSRQNICREAVGLKPRTPPQFNLFMDENKIINNIGRKMKLIHIDDFGSLHDIVLYVLVPMVNKGEYNYDNPYVQAATKLSLKISEKYDNPFGNFGQNRLYLFHKEK